jgi:hypothetical protein
LHHIETRGFDAELSIEVFRRNVQLLAEQAQQRFHLALGAADADRDGAVAAVDAEEMQFRAPCAGAADVEFLDHVAAQMLGGDEDGFDVEERLEETAEREHRRRRTAWAQRFGRAAERLIETQHGAFAGAGGERGARRGHKLADGLEAEAAQKRGGVCFEAKSFDGERRE